MFAATHPERTRALVLYAPLVKGTGSEDFPWALAPELQHMFGGQLPAAWGSEPMARLLAGVVAPSLADDQPFLQFLAKAMRSSVSPGAAKAWLRMIADIDVREALPQIRVPTLLVHRTGDRAVDVGASRYAAGRIPGARLVELPDGDNLTFVGDTEAVAAEIEEFLTGSRTPPLPDRVLATILFTDIAGSTEHAAEVGDRRWRELLGRHDALAREQLERYRGREVKMTGDGLLATFDGPARAVTCAAAIGRAVRGLGLEVRAAVHTGEVELRDGDIGGIAVHIASRVMGLARPNEVLVSSYGEGPGRGSRDPVRGPECPVPPGGARPVAAVRCVHLTRPSSTAIPGCPRSGATTPIGPSVAWPTTRFSTFATPAMTATKTFRSAEGRRRQQHLASAILPADRLPSPGTGEDPA
ncbi:MAG TPA: adenylate/guanylate cyclase domain-containing protein [Actinomycetes bacterium]|nr:adenylate/guanylate cyclase domain-containing protein [Actinomycetes bacterium]